jgi:hypothetical protein
MTVRSFFIVASLALAVPAAAQQPQPAPQEPD